MNWACAVALGGVLTLGAGAAGATGFVDDGASYLLTIQDAGGFFHDASAASFYASTQGQMGLGMLTAYQQSCATSCNTAYLNSAVALGNAMLDPATHAAIGSEVQQNELYFDAAGTNPIVWSQSTLFLQRLTQVTGNANYSNFLKTELWDKLAAGSYGNDPTATNPNRFSDIGGVNTLGWAAVAQTRCDDYSPWCIAKPAVAAKMAGDTSVAADFMAGIKLGLENFSGPGDGTWGLEILGLAAAVWASQITGIDVTPTTGYWAGNDTAGLAAQLALLVDGSGGFPPGIYAGAPATDVETTGVAILALTMTNPVGYQDTIVDALSFLQAQQAGNGCVEVDAGSNVCDDSIHGEVLQYYSEVVADDTGEAPVIRTPSEIQNTFYVPEPGTLLLFFAGCAGMAAARRRCAA